MTGETLVILVSLFVLFLVFCAYVAENWPRRSPFLDDEERRR